MMRLDNGIDLSGGRSEKSTFLIVLGLVMAGFFIGQFVSSMFIVVFVLAGGGGLDAVANMDLLFDAISKTQFMIAQSAYTLTFTFLTPWFYLKLFAKKSFGSLYLDRKTTVLPVILTILGTLAFMFFNTIVIEWNASWDFPDFMAGIERWMQETEAQLAETTEMLATFNNFGEFLIAFLVIAILPGIGEEYLFRGVLQNSLHRWSKNAHLAIWFSAFLFAAIHLQFYGLVPRMMLGALFGYLYLWTGNLWYPIIAHIANNGISLILTYLYQLEVIGLNIDDSESSSPIYSIMGLVAMLGIFYVFRSHHLKPKTDL